MTFEERFSKISKKLINADLSKYSESFAIQITMDDEDCGGTFFAAFNDGAFRVEPYDYVDNTASVNVTADVLGKLVDKKTTVEAAIYDGVLSVNGNVNHVAMLFDGFEKKAPAKRTTTKKTATKKTAEKKEEKPAEKKPAAKKEPAKKATKTTKKTK